MLGEQYKLLGEQYKLLGEQHKMLGEQQKKDFEPRKFARRLNIKYVWNITNKTGKIWQTMY